jgi:archaellum component FlaC
MPTHVLNAVVKSTDKYLELLENHEMGRSHHAAANVQRLQEDFFTENKSVPCYTCDLSPQQGIQKDETATFIPTNEPGDHCDIRIISYNKTTGATKFASQAEIREMSGEIVVDFRWLVRRCRQWYQERGGSLHSPGLLGIREREQVFFPPAEMTDEQEKAVKTMLESRLSYIWGPPGTGKTRMVLANAVKYCVDQGFKVLVVAPTNLGVDNALSGVLEARVETTKVLRIGIPSEQFQAVYPECCELKVVMSLILELRSEITRLQSEIENFHQSVQLRDSIIVSANHIHMIECELNDLSDKLPALYGALSHAESKKQEALEALNALECQITVTKSEMESLQLAQRKSEINVLEREHTELIRDKQTNDYEASKLGLIARLFTDKRQKTAEALKGILIRLNVVEGTLANKRDEYAKLIPISQTYAAKITNLDLEISNLRLTHQDAAQKVERLEGEIYAISAKTNELDARVLSLKRDEHANLRALEQLVHVLPKGEPEPVKMANQNRINQLQGQIDAITLDLGSKSVLGMTLDGFIGLTMQMTLEADHIFVDEAAYAALAKVIPLLSIGCPISMLGDHCQLPPVCEVKKNPTVQAYWGKSAIFLENAFHLRDEYSRLKQQVPRTYPFGWTETCVLSKSHRYSEDLAYILDQHIYRMGLTGVPKENISIRCIACSPVNQNGIVRRQNITEAESLVSMVASWWARIQNETVKGNAAILSPYKNQAKLIRHRLQKRFSLGHAIWEHLEVMNTHKSQGREWDTVFFSAVDSGNMLGNRPFLADTNTPQGRAVMNTSISRVKSNLRIFLDADYWSGQNPPSMLDDLARRFVAP